MKYFRLKNFLKTIKFYVAFLIVSIMLISFCGLNISSAAISANADMIKSVEIENNSTILNNDDVYNIETITKEMFGEVNVDTSEYLYNLDGSSDYIYVKFENGGYAVYYKETMELLEYSAQGSLSYPNASVSKYYGGPSMYLTKQNDCFIDTLTGELLDISSKSAKLYSCKVRDTLISNFENHETQTSVDFDYSSIGVNDLSIENNIPDYYYMDSELFHEDIDTVGNLEEDIPSYDRDSLIRVIDGTYIPNYNYFLCEPLHGQNQTGTCGAISAQLLLSYNNYYNDRRIIANKYLNGSTSEPEKNPNLCADPMLMNKNTLGTRGYYEDGRDDSNSYFKYIVDKIPHSATIAQVGNGLRAVLNDRNKEIDGAIDFSVSAHYGSSSTPIDSKGVISEINAGRPVIIAMQESLGGTDHAVVAYGYQNYTYPNTTTSYLGYITHFGWKSDAFSNYLNIWVNSSWCHTYYSLKIDHVHDYTKIGTIENIGRIEYKCDTCGHRIGKASDGYLNIINVGKQGASWRILVENPFNTSVTVYYNSKMSSLDDAKNWTDLTDITKETISGESSKILTITENVFATSIVLSYIKDGIRYITYADQFNTDGNMHIMYNNKAVDVYTQNGMKVSIVGKNGGTWLIELTNNTGSPKTFEYNSKMCFEGDAKDWTGLSDIKHTATLLNGATTSEPIEISENGTATSIAISYMDGDYRKIFYAYNLNESGTMVANENEIDTTAPPSEECVAAGTLITLADGSKKAVEELTGSEMLLVWNLHTGTFDTAPILFIDSELIGHYEVIELTFSDGATVDVISEHGFWDVELNKYVYLDENAAEYIGHSFMKQDESGMTQVILMDVEISTEVTTAYSPVTYGNLCYYVNGMLSMPGGIDGLFNIFEVDEQTMKYDIEAMQSDINTYGLFTYEEFNALYNVPEVVFEACDGQYLKVAIGKGLITHDEIVELIEKYAGYIAV